MRRQFCPKKGLSAPRQRIRPRTKPGAGEWTCGAVSPLSGTCRAVLSRHTRKISRKLLQKPFLAGFCAADAGAGTRAPGAGCWTTVGRGAVGTPYADAIRVAGVGLNWTGRVTRARWNGPGRHSSFWAGTLRTRSGRALRISSMAVTAMTWAGLLAGQACGPAPQARWAPRLWAWPDEVSAGSLLAPAKLMTRGEFA